MSIKYINDLEVVTAEENITGEEKVLIVQDSVTKLVPMNLIKGSTSGSEDESIDTNVGGGVLILDVSNYVTSGNIYLAPTIDKSVGDTVKEAIQNGQIVCLYDEDTYLYPYMWKLTFTTVTPGSKDNPYWLTAEIHNRTFMIPANSF